MNLWRRHDTHKEYLRSVAKYFITEIFFVGEIIFVFVPKNFATSFSGSHVALNPIEIKVVNIFLLQGRNSSGTLT